MFSRPSARAMRHPARAVVVLEQAGTAPSTVSVRGETARTSKWIDLLHTLSTSSLALTTSS